MASSKVFFLLGLAFAVVLLISSEVSARELTQTTQTKEVVQTDSMEAKYGGHGYGHGYGYGYGYGHGQGNGYGYGYGHGGKPGHGGHPGHNAVGKTETNQN